MLGWLRRFFTVALVGAALQASATAGEYVLAPGDEVRIDVLDRSDLSGSYRVRDDGRISIHLLGSIMAEGRTIGDLERGLDATLRARMASPLPVRVEAVAYAPVHVMGDVGAPGAYDFREGMTVLQAVARAGGYLRPLRMDDHGLALRLADEANKLRRLRRELAELLVRRARLLAERDGREGLTPPPEAEALVGDGTAALVAEQEAIMRSRRTRLAENRAAAREQERLTLAEAAALARRQEHLAKQIELTSERLAEVEDLKTRGLAVTDRVRLWRRELSTYRGDRMSTAAFEAQARQDAAAAADRVVGLKVERDVEIARALADTAVRERSLRGDIAAAQNLLLRFGGRAALVAGTEEPPRPVFEIVRHRADAAGEFIAAPATPLQPGDVLTVRLVVAPATSMSASAEH